LSAPMVRGKEQPKLVQWFVSNSREKAQKSTEVELKLTQKSLKTAPWTESKRPPASTTVDDDDDVRLDGSPEHSNAFSAQSSLPAFRWQKSEPPSEEQKGKVFTEAYRMLEIATERKLNQKSAVRDDDEKTVLPDDFDGADEQDVRGMDDNNSVLSDVHGMEDMGTMRSGGAAGMEDTRSMTSMRSCPMGSVYTPLKEAELRQVWSDLQNRRLPSPLAAYNIIRQMRQHLKTETSVMGKVPKPTAGGRVIIVGDLHGHAADFWHVLTHYGNPSSKNMYLFNGDFVDRGIWGPEVVLALFVLRLLNPLHVFLNRGNHESEICTKFYGFAAHMACAYPDNHKELYDMMHKAFDMLPLCHIVGEKVFVVHAGLPHFVPMLADIEKVPRGPIPYPAKNQRDQLAVALVWSDPRQRTGDSDRGIGWHFGAGLTRNFLQWNQLNYIVRSHECVDGGFQETHGNLVKTVFSASNYDLTNNANVAVINEHLVLSKGDPWNEVYIKQEWLDEAQDDPYEFNVEDMESAGGNFQCITLQVEREEGQNLGFLLNAENPTVQTPIVTELQTGIVAEHNAMYPDNAVMVGDCILTVNNMCGYDNIKTQLSTSRILHLRFRRPKKVEVKLTAEEKKTMPPVNGVFFAEAGFAFALDRWGPLMRVDRIREVNGKVQGEEMRAELKSDRDCHIALLRYAPPEFVPIRPDEAVAQQLRNKVVSAWKGDDKDGSAQNVADLVRNRLTSGDKEMAGSHREFVLAQVHMMIYLSRAVLLESFQLQDKAVTPSRISFDGSGLVPDWKGHVTKEQWIHVMQHCDAPDNFPWRGLRHYLAKVEDGRNRMYYIPFLLRYQNPMSRWLLKRWVIAAFDQIAFQTRTSLADAYSRLDSEGLGKLDFSTCRSFFSSHLFPQTAHREEQEYQEVLIFALFRTMSENSPGAQVIREDFERTLFGRQTTTAYFCGNRVLRNKTATCCCKEVFHCNVCDEKIVSEHWDSCDEVDFDMCPQCKYKRLATDKKTAEESVRMASSRFLEWARVRNFLEILSSNNVNVSQLFDRKLAKNVARDHFIEVVADLFQDAESARALHMTVCDYLRDTVGIDTAQVNIKTLIESFNIVDIEMPLHTPAATLPVPAGSHKPARPHVDSMAA